MWWRQSIFPVGVGTRRNFQARWYPLLLYFSLENFFFQNERESFILFSRFFSLSIASSSLFFLNPVVVVSLSHSVFISISFFLLLSFPLFSFFLLSTELLSVVPSFGTVNADARSAKLEDLFHVSCKLHSVPAEGGIHHVKWTFSYWSPAVLWPPARALHLTSLGFSPERHLYLADCWLVLFISIL